MEMFLKMSYKLMFKFDVYFRNMNSFGDMLSYRPQLKHKTNQKA